MSNEIRVQSGLTVRKADSSGVLQIQHTTTPGGFSTDMTGNKGPVPGALQAKLGSAGGTQVDFSQLTRPTFCEFKHLGRSDGVAATQADYVEYGIYDPATHKFYPLGELYPGETYVLRLSRNIQEIYVGPGTGTAAGGETARLMLLAHNTTQNVAVNAFEF